MYHFNYIIMENSVVFFDVLTVFLIALVLYGALRLGRYIDNCYEQEAERLNNLAGQKILTGISLRKIEQANDGYWAEFSDKEKIARLKK